MLANPYNVTPRLAFEDVMHCEVAYVKKTITYQVQVNDGLVIRTRYRGMLETFLNGTATFILKRIAERSSVIDTLVEGVMEEYGVKDRLHVEIDVVDCISELWKLAIIRWVSSSPFQLKKELPDGGTIFRVTHDTVREILALSKGCSKYTNPVIGKINQESLTAWLLGLVPIYAHSERGCIKQVIALTETDISGIMFIYSLEKNHDSLIRYILENNSGIKMITAQVPMMDCDSTDVILGCGLCLCGRLRNEIESGDVLFYAL
jgi:hypothetical protein